MGLLDSLIGSAVSGALGAPSDKQEAGGINPALIAALLPVVLGMLSNNSEQGGLAGLVNKFKQAGLGDQINSWISNGQNLPVSGEQVSAALGSDVLGNLAQQAGLGQSELAGSLASLLPGIINSLTPQGQAPAGGLGNNADLMGALGGLMGGQAGAGGLGGMLGGLAGASLKK